MMIIFMNTFDYQICVMQLVLFIIDHVSGAN